MEQLAIDMKAKMDAKRGGLYDPKMPVLRSELAFLISEGLGLTKATPDNYSDLAVSYWAKDEIDRVLTQDIMIGYPDNTFKPDKAINKAEVFCTFAKMMNVPASATAVPVLSGQQLKYIPEWAYAATNEVIASGILNVLPDQDKVIYSRLTQDTIPVKVEKLFPEEEKPVMPEVVAEPIESTEEEIPVFEETEEIQIVQAEPLPVKEEVKKVEPKKQVTPVKSEKPKGEWKVQLFSSTDKVKVEKQWQIISKKQKALVSDMPMQIVPAQIEGKGTFYRLQVGVFETREMANNLCTKLKKRKQDCIPAK